MPPQFQPSSQMPMPVGSAGAQPWMHSNQGTPVVAPLQQGSLESFPTTATVPVSVFNLFLFHIKPPKGSFSYNYYLYQLEFQTCIKVN